MTLRGREMMGEWSKLVIPLKRSGNLLLIEAEIDSLRGDFILDTGAPSLVLNQTYFRSSRKSNYQASGVNGNAGNEVYTTSIERVSIGVLHYESLDADIISLAHIEDKRNVRILGLFGSGLFSSCIMLVDMVASQLVLIKTTPDGNMPNTDLLTPEEKTLLESEPDIAMPFKLCDDKIFLPVTVSGVKMNWILDTGAETNVMDAGARKKVLNDFIINRRIRMNGSTGTQDVLLGIMPEIKVGEETFTMQQTIVTGMDDLSETCSLYIDGILGYSFLSRGVFYLNFSSREFRFYIYKTKE